MSLTVEGDNIYLKKDRYNSNTNDICFMRVFCDLHKVAMSLS
jgi:hypothetical protein